MNYKYFLNFLLIVTLISCGGGGGGGSSDPEPPSIFNPVINTFTSSSSSITSGNSIDLSWTNFDVEFAFYYLVTDNVVKCGAVGLKGSKNSESLNARLSGYRTTHARLKLINVIYLNQIGPVSYTHLTLPTKA
mgnify:CR=1 FL=1